MPSQTETQRKATAQKAAATRRTNAAKRSRAARKAAETRARAQMNRLQAAGLQAQRAGDTALGAALSSGESVVDAVRPLSDPRRELKRLQGSLSTAARKAETRGARARKSALRSARRTRTDVEQRVDTTRSDAEERIGDVQSRADGFRRRVEDQARNLG